MGDLILQQNETEIVNLLHNVVGEFDIPMPFERDIFLYGTEIAGTRYVENIEELYETIEVGDMLALVREPDNPYDEYAIRIETVGKAFLGYFPTEDTTLDDGNKLGYIPRVNNRIIARLMDAGKLIYGVVRHKEVRGGYHKIVVKVYMKE